LGDFFVLFSKAQWEVVIVKYAVFSHFKKKKKMRLRLSLPTKHINSSAYSLS